MKIRFWSLMLWMCLLPTVTYAQDTKKPTRLIGLKDLPRYLGAGGAEVTPDGDLMLINRPKFGSDNTPIVRLIAASTMFQVDPISFSEPNWTQMRIEHAQQHSSGDLWVIGESEVGYRTLSDGWASIPLGKVNKRACQRKLFRGPCQTILPISKKLAVALRPIYEKDKNNKTILSTEVIGVSHGEPKPLMRVNISNIVMGPAVADGVGGFWAMMQRVNRGTNYKSLRGYLHYTKDGDWHVWSDSKETVPGTTFKGIVGFVIDPDVRKMSSDGAGGFVAIGKDRKVYRVDKNGKSQVFSPNVPDCQFCQPLSVSMDVSTSQLHLLMAKWQTSEVGAIKMVEVLRWMRFDATGKILDSQLVPRPKTARRINRRSFYRRVRVVAGGGNAWVVSPGMVMHKDKQEWSWISSRKKVERMLMQQHKQQEKNKRNKSTQPAVILSAIGGAALSVGMLAYANGLSDEVDGPNVLAPFGIGMLSGYFIGQWLYPFVLDRGDPAQLRWTCLSTTLPAMPLGVGLTTWLTAEAAHPDSDHEYQGRQFLGSVGGAAAGTLVSVLLARLIYGLDEDASDVLVTMIGASIVSSASTLGYFLSD